MVTKPEDVGLSSERLARVNAWAQRLVDDGKVAGMITSGGATRQGGALQRSRLQIRLEDLWAK